MDQLLARILAERRRQCLRQSILERAFTGQLVPQDPNDEPASVLLARIKAARLGKAKPEQMKLKGI